MKTLHILCASTALVLPAAAMAQSTGTVDFENNNAIVVTGTRTANVGGIEVPDTSKTREVLGAEFIQHQTPGQSINETINSLPGVSFTNNDPFGSAGGTLYIRGFDQSRISETFDGIPLNDTGNYALYSNQQLDPELIEQVNVSLGSTDVDSPTAAATGSTVNYRTRLPYQNFAVRLEGSYGWFDGGDYFRTFGTIDTGEFGPWHTRAFVAASMATNDNVYGHRGTIYKQQYNARIYQPLGSNGDFISISGHYNQNRNNFFGSLPLRIDTTQNPVNNAPRVVGGDTSNRFPITRAERDYTVARCETNQVARPGVFDAANSCGSAFEERLNPSNTGNIRINSRFTLSDGLVLTVDPSFQYVKANGGGTVVAQEGFRDVDPAGGNAAPPACVTTPNAANLSCQIGYLGGTPYFGRDLNGDGDLLDTVRVLAPSQTQTRRYGVIAGLRWDINDTNTVRIGYTFDRGHHRQTGETGFLQINGQPFQAFPVNDPIIAANGDILQKRDRVSIALLNQVSGEYRGEFFDNRLTVNIGVRAPFFTRDLTNNCLTSSATGFVECFGANTQGLADYIALNPTVNVGGVPQPVQGPQNRVFHYNKILPNVGLTYDIMPRMSLYANYSRGLQVPGTDNLYNAFFFAADNPSARPKPEVTDNFDVGIRYRSSRIMAQLAGWYTIFTNRLASSYDPELDATVYRNLGTVDKYGIDASVAWQIVPQFQLNVFGSYLWSHIRDDVQNGICGTTVSASCPAGSAGQPIFAPTAGNRESGSAAYTFGARAQGTFGPLEVGAQIKRTGPRYLNDSNLPLVQCVSNTGSNAFVNGVDCNANLFQVYPARTPAFTIVDLDARLNLGFLGLNDDTFLQFNVTNLFDKLYVGNFGGALTNTSVPFVQIGAPRAFIATLNVGFR